MKKIRLAVVGINYPDYVVGVGMIRQLAPEEYSDTELFITCDRMNIYDPEAKMVSYFGFDLGHISWFDLFKLGHLDEEPVNARLLEVRPHAFIIEAEVPDVVKPLQYGKCPIVLDTAFLLEASKQEQHFCKLCLNLGKMIDNFFLFVSSDDRADEGFAAQRDRSLRKILYGMNLLMPNYQPSYYREQAFFIGMTADQFSEIEAMLPADDPLLQEFVRCRHWLYQRKAELTRKEVKLEIYHRYLAYAQDNRQTIEKPFWQSMVNHYGLMPSLASLSHELEKLRFMLGEFLKGFDPEASDEQVVLASVISYRFLSKEEIQSFFSCRILYDFLKKKIGEIVSDSLSESGAHCANNALCVYLHTPKVDVAGDFIQNHGSLLRANDKNLQHIIQKIN